MFIFCQRIILLLILTTFGGCSLFPASHHSMEHGVPRTNAEKTTPELCDNEGDSKSDSVDIRCAKTVSASVATSGRIWFARVVGGHLYVNYSDDLGETLSTPIQVNHHPEKIAARGENRPKIALDGAGNIYVSWIKRLPKKWTSDVRFAWLDFKELDNQERRFSLPQTVNDDGKVTGHSFNEMVVTEGGEVTIAWLDGRHALAAKEKGQKFVGSSIYWAQDNPSRNKTNNKKGHWKNVKHVDGSCVCCRLALALNPVGQPLLMWRHIFGDNIRDHALALLEPKLLEPELDKNPVRRVSFENWKIDGCPHHGPAIAVQGLFAEQSAKAEIAKEEIPQARTHLSWFSDAEQAKGLFYAYTDNQGRSLSPVVHLADQSAVPSHPTLAVNHSGGVLLAWQEFDGARQTVKLMRSDRGDRWSSAEVIASNTGKTDYPFLLSHPDAELLLWHKPGHSLKIYKVQ